jgi:hypothetical protein
VVLRLDQDEEVRLQDDRKGGAVIDQPFRPESVVALPDRTLGELIGEELRRLDPDEPYSEALESVTGTTGLSDRPACRDHVWYDPMRPEQSVEPTNGDGEAPPPASAEVTAVSRPAPTVPDVPGDTDEIALSGEHDSPADDSDEQPVVQAASAPSAKKAGKR